MQSSRLGGVLRGSVNSMVGAAGLNLPLRAVERLTGALENATAILERLERATGRLDRLDDDIVERAQEALDAVNEMSEDTRLIAERMESLEEEVRELREVITQRLDRVPLLRPRGERRSGERTQPKAARRPRR